MLTIGEFARLGQVSPRMLRHYDSLGLLCPSRVDAATGYRYYSAEQLSRLHRLVALRDLGFGLDQIGGLLASDEVPVAELRGMLVIRRAQISQLVSDEQARLARVEAHLRALERSSVVPDVVVKQTQPLRVSAATCVSPGLGHQNLGPVFGQVLPRVLGYLGSAGARPGMSVAWYDEPDEDGSVVLHAGFEVGGQSVPSGDEVSVVDLPVIEVASVIHRGPMDGVEAVYEDLVRWAEERGFRMAGRSRELYLEWHDDDPSQSVTELQLPIERRGA